MALRSMKKGDPVKASLTLSPNLNSQIEEKINYILSPVYKRRLLEMGQPEGTVNKLIKERVNVLKNTELRPYKSTGGDWSGGGSASRDLKTNRPYLAWDTSKSNADTTFAHELGHLTSGIDRNTLPNTTYQPDYRGYRSIYDSRNELANIIGSGGSMYMSPAEKYFIDLQNKNSNELPVKGFLYDKWHNGRSINDWFYNQPNEEKSPITNWPLGTRVNLDQVILEQPSTSIASSTRNPTIANGIKAMKKNPTFVSRLLDNPAYGKDFLSNIHEFDPYQANNGIPGKSYATSLSGVLSGQYDPHDYGAGENKADLDAVRFVLKKYGYTKNFGDDISQDLWQKALKDKRVNQDEHIKRMRKNFSDKSIINLNNRVAYENNSPLQSMKSTDYNV
jgi:hypothetical protein